MTKFLTAATLIIAVSAGSLAVTNPAAAGPHALSSGPFSAVNGR